MMKKPANHEIQSFFYFPIVIFFLLLLLRIAVAIDFNNLYTTGLGFALVGVNMLFALGFQILASYLVLLPFAIFSKRMLGMPWNIFDLIGLTSLAFALALFSINAGFILPEMFYAWLF